MIIYQHTGIKYTVPMATEVIAELRKANYPGSGDLNNGDLLRQFYSDTAAVFRVLLNTFEYRNKWVTWLEFANLIKSHYDYSNPQTAFTVDLIKLGHEILNRK